MGGMRFGGPRGFLTEEEKSNVPKVTKELLLRILGYLKPYWPQFILVFVTIILSATIGLLPSIITGKIVDQAAIVDRQPLERLQVLQRGDVPKLRELIQVQRFQLDGVREEGKIRNGNTVIQREGGQTDSSLIDPLRSGRTPASMQAK